MVNNILDEPGQAAPGGLFRDENIYALADDLFRTVAEELLSVFVKKGQGPVALPTDDGAVCVLDEFTVLALTLLELDSRLFTLGGKP